VKGITKRVNVNQRIRAREVRLIGEDGEQIGIVPIAEALQIAGSKGLDLVEVASNAKPPVCRIMDYGKFKYEQKKKFQEAKKKQSTSQVKEIKVRPKTGDHDLDVKLRHVKRFLENRDKVKISMQFRGREIAYTGLGRDLMKKVAELASEFAVVEDYPKMEGRRMIMILAPK
jgi:translation initiation factor IF-3